MRIAFAEIACVADETIGAALAAAVERYGDREAFVFDDRRLTFRDAEREADAVARALLASGVRRGTHVAVWLANHPEWTALYFAILKIGAVLVPLSTRYRPDELAFGLEKIRAPLLFFKHERKGRTDYGDLLREVLPRASHVKRVIDVADPPMAGTEGYAAFLARGHQVTGDQLAAASRTVQPTDVAIVMYTSGTTSFPKGACLSHEGTLYSAVMTSRVLGLSERDTFFTLQPMYHSGGALGIPLRPLVTGCRVVTQAYFEPGAALDTMEREGATVISGHQPHYVEYMNHPTLPQRKLALERAMIIGPPEMFWMVSEKLGITGLISGYAMTETNLVGTANALDDPQEIRFNTVGRPVDGVDLEIRDPDDLTVLPQGAEGEIFLRVPHPMLGYFEEPEQTAAVLDADGWYRTSDRGMIRHDGNLCLFGRVRDMIRVGGENLSGAEVEAVLMQHPAVKQAAAVAAPDQRLGEVVVAFLETKSGATTSGDEILAYCRERLAHFKVPRRVHFVSEWPLTGSGKIQKRSLLEPVS